MVKVGRANGTENIVKSFLERRSKPFSLETSGKELGIDPGPDEKGNEVRAFLSNILYFSPTLRTLPP